MAWPRNDDSAIAGRLAAFGRRPAAMHRTTICVPHSGPLTAFARAPRYGHALRSDMRQARPLCQERR